MLVTSTLQVDLIESAVLGNATPTLVYKGERIEAPALKRQIGAFANSLARLGIARGDRIAVWLPNCPAWLVAHLGAARIGAMTMAVNTRFRSTEVEDILARSGARLLLYWPGFLEIDFDAALAQVHPSALARLAHVVAYTEGASGPPASKLFGVPQHDYLQLVAGAVEVELDKGRQDDGAILFTTSGTTGKPKLALHTQASISSHADQVAPAFGYDAPNTALLQALPLCGTFGHAQAMAVLRASGKLVLMPAFGLEPALELVSEHRVSALNGADTMFEDMMVSSNVGALASVHGGGFAAFATPDVEDFVARAARFHLELFGLYGMSEVQALFARQKPGASVEERASGGGYLVSPQASFRVCDPDSGQVLPLGEAGELQLKGPSLFREYFENPQATARAMTDDGYLRTGDLARDEGDGRFTYLARMGDSLRLRGFLTSPAEIEAVIEQHPCVAIAQVVGVDTSRGTRPFAFVTRRNADTPDLGELATLCSERLAKYKVPIRFVALDEFPMTDSPNGQKIQRVRLREMALMQVEAPG